MQPALARSTGHGGALGALLALAACSTAWEPPTYFVFEDLDPALPPRLRSAVAAHGFQPLDADEARALGVGERDCAFRLAGIRTSQQLLEAKRALEEVLREAAIEARPLRAELRYGCVAVPPSAASSTLVARGRATPGATLRLDVGGAELLGASALEDGIWSLSVPSSPALEARGGWIYGEAAKGAARQLFRLNLLTGSQESIVASDLPTDSALR
ncbi:MAG: hypothetical protein IPN34_02020 [Planctomycetes bacterium]|nr:hypothetical protein [Planctomycetota bacterium]